MHRQRTRWAVAVAMAVGVGALLGSGVALAQMSYTLRDGSVVVGNPVAEDEGTVTVQTSIGMVQLHKGNIVGVQPAGGAPQYGQPAPAYGYAQPAPGYAYQQQPAPPRRGGTGLLVAGWIVFGVSYGLTILYASVMSGVGDPFASWGYVPVIGPIMWSLSWAGTGYENISLGLLGTALQAGGVALIITGMAVRASSSAERRRPDGPRFAIAPAIGPGLNGLVVAGTF